MQNCCSSFKLGTDLSGALTESSVRQMEPADSDVPGKLYKVGWRETAKGVHQTFCRVWEEQKRMKRLAF